MGEDVNHSEKTVIQRYKTLDFQTLVSTQLFRSLRLPYPLVDSGQTVQCLQLQRLFLPLCNFRSLSEPLQTLNGVALPVHYPSPTPQVTTLFHYCQICPCLEGVS
jgi:hypothetical protein